MMMIGQNHHLSTLAAGCAIATSSAAIIDKQQQQKLPKVRYGAFFSGKMQEMDREAEEEELFSRRNSSGTINAAFCRKRAKSPRPGGLRDEEQQQERKGFSRRLLGKLVKLISVKEFTFLPSGKTFPSRDAKKAKAAAAAAAKLAAARRQNGSSQSSTLSGSFEPMPTIEEETESELMQQLMAEAEAILEMGQQMHQCIMESSSNDSSSSSGGGNNANGSQQQQSMLDQAAVVQAAA